MDDAPPKRPRGRPRKAAPGQEAATVQALDRGLQLLALLARQRRIGLSALALSAGMPPSTAHRLLGTLQAHGLVEFDEAHQAWMVGVEAFRIGAAFLSRINVVEAAQEVMQDLMAETGETANLAIADAGDIVFVSQIETQNPIRAFFRPGTRSHMHASGAGKALLAQLSEAELERLLRAKGLPEFTRHTITQPERLTAELATIRRRGWSFDDEERYEGMRCVAAPVWTAQGKAAAAISVSGPTVRFSEARVADFSAAVRRAAQALTERLGGHPP